MVMHWEKKIFHFLKKTASGNLLQLTGPVGFSQMGQQGWNHNTTSCLYKNDIFLMFSGFWFNICWTEHSVPNATM